MSNNDDRKVLEIERELEDALDEDSISQMLDGYQARKRPASSHEHVAPGALTRRQKRKTLEVDSEALIGSAPSSEARDEPPTIEAYVGEAPDAHMPEAAVVMPKKRTRKRADAGAFPTQPPPLPDDVARAPRQRDRAPAKPPEVPTKARAGLHEGDLRPLDRGPERRWELDEISLSSVLLEVVKTPGLGLLEVRTGSRRAQLIVEDGQIHEVRLLPALAKRSLTAFLERGGKLSPKTAAQIRRNARRRGIGEAQALLRHPEIISPNVVRSAVCSQTRYLLRRLLEAKLSRAAFYTLDEESSASHVVSVPLVGILFSHVRAAHSAKFSGNRERARQGFADKQLSKKSNLAFSANQLGLDLHERQLIDRVLTKARPFEKVLKNSPVSHNETVALLAALEAVGLLEVEAPGLGEAASSSWAEDYAETLERIELMEARLERENHFALFGLHWTSYDSEIARTYRQISQIFKTSNLPLGLSPDERRRVRDVKKRIDAIYDRLKDADRRETYRRKLIGATTRARAAKKLEALASAAFRRKSLHSALDYYQRLLELEPNHKRANQLLPVLIARTSSR